MRVRFFRNFMWAVIIFMNHDLSHRAGLGVARAIVRGDFLPSSQLQRQGSMQKRNTAQMGNQATEMAMMAMMAMTSGLDLT